MKVQGAVPAVQPVQKYARLPFWGRVDSSAGYNECWEWLGAVQSAGYGFTSKGLAHRIAYELRVGQIPKGLTIDHLCRNKLCCNPRHMEAVTLAENLRRAVATRNHHRGGNLAYAARTHCKWGHEYTEENTRMSGNARVCKACAKRRSKEFQNRRKREGS